MNSEQETQAANMKKQIDDYDCQIAAIQRLKVKAQKDLDAVVPKVSDQMQNLKRKASQRIEKDFEALIELLAKDRIFNNNKKDEELEEDEVEEVEVEVEANNPIDQAFKKTPTIIKRRNVYSPETKKAIALCIKEHGYAEVQKRTKMSLCSLKTIKRLYNKNGCNKKRGKPVRFPEIDADVREWIVERRLKGIKITTKRTMCYARKLAKERGHGDVSFTWGWLRRFLKRHRLSLRKPSTSAAQPDASIIEQAKKFILRRVLKL